MSPALEAAFRLSLTLPSKIHRKPDPKPRPYPAHGPVPADKLQHMRELEALGIPRKQMAQQLRMSPDTIREKLGLRKRGPRRGGWK